MIPRRALLAGLALSAAPANAQARPSLFGPHPDYEATGWFDRGARQPARLHRTRNALRHHASDGIERITIARLDLDKAWLHVPALRLAFETDLTGLGLAPALLRGGGFRETAVRTATVDGVPATQLRVTRDGPDVAFDALALVDRRGVLWQLEGTGSVGGNGGRLDWRFEDVRVGPLDPALFEAPQAQMVPVAGETLLATLRRFGLVR
ncbi:MAG: hypothetical protein NBV67_12550 [Tagaea sp.]|nr:hypothetical protein [Tagaea sp.]